MTKEQYDSELNEIKKDYESRVRNLGRKYAETNNPVQVGFIVEDDSGLKIQVQNITWGKGFFGDYPYCIYKGIELKKDNTPKKSGATNTIIQPRLKTL